MADSTMSDADKIRAKRLAKLGGGANSSAAPSPPPTQGTAAPAPSVDATSPPTQPTAAPAVSADQPPSLQQSTMNGQQEGKDRPVRQINMSPRPSSPAKRERDGSEKPRMKAPETFENWQDRILRQIFRVRLQEDQDREHNAIYLASTRQDLVDGNSPILLNTDVLEGAILEAAGHAPRAKPFEYLLGCFKRVSKIIRNTKFSSPEDPKHDVLKEARRLCMSYCVFAVTMPKMFGENVPATNPLVDHLLTEPECDTGICTDFLTEASSRFDEDETIKEAVVDAAEKLSRQLSEKNMLQEYTVYMRALHSLVRFPKIVEALTQSPMWAPPDIAAQDIERKTLLGPFFRLSPMQLDVAQSYFPDPTPKPGERPPIAIANAQNAIRITLRTHQQELYQVARLIARAGKASQGKLLDWFAICVNKNHKKRAMRVDHKVVSSDGFLVNVTSVLDQLCEPFMDAKFGNIEKIHAEYFRRNPRVDISDETKINADQKTADQFYSNKRDEASGFTSELFFLTVAAHHYGTEAAQTSVGPMRKTAQRMAKQLEEFKKERPKYAQDARYLARYEAELKKFEQQIDNTWCIIHATHGVLMDELSQQRSMQFMRYVIVWLLRLASDQNLPAETLRIPLPDAQPDVFKCLPEYFLEDITDNFKFITGNIPQILTPQQCEEIVQICITLLRNSEYVKNAGVKSGLVTILCYGVHPVPGRPNGVLGDLLMGSDFANKHLLHALMKFYIEAESTGSHTQFFDKFNIRYEIFQVIKSIWPNTRYRDNLAKEAKVNTDFFVQFANMLVNDVTFTLDESLSAFVKIHDLTEELGNEILVASFSEEEKKEKEDLLEDYKGRAKSYMGLTRETMDTLKLFSESLPDSFTMPEIVTRLADMLDFNLETMVGPKSGNLKVQGMEEYGFQPASLLADIFSVYCNLSAKENFIHAIARDLRSYKPYNFAKAKDIMDRKKLKSPEELRVWQTLADNVAKAKAEDEEEEQDLGEPPDEFMDPLTADLMKDPVILPSSRSVVDRSTIRSHLLSDPTDPFNRMPLKIEDVVPDVELKGRIEAWRAERKAERAKEKAAQQAEAMDTSEG